MVERPDAHAYWVRDRGVGELRPTAIASIPGRGHSIVRADFGSVSAGTERLIGLGRVPSSCLDAMSCRYMAGDFSLPIKYGYSLVGTGVAGELTGKRVFVMHPHQTEIEIADEHAVVLPEDLSAARATLIPNTETALNAVWDAELNGEDRCVIVGAGAVGLLVAFVLHPQHTAPVTVVELDERRRAFCADLDFVDAVHAPGDLDDAAFSVSFHATGGAAGLQQGVDLVGYEGRVLDLSWYGDQAVELRLGTDFHFARKRIQASQVAAIAPSHRATHSHADRLALVLDLLKDSRTDRILSPPVPFAALPEFMSQLYAGELPADFSHPTPLICYGGEDA